MECVVEHIKAAWVDANHKVFVKAGVEHFHNDKLRSKCTPLELAEIDMGSEFPLSSILEGSPDLVAVFLKHPVALDVYMQALTAPDFFVAVDVAKKAAEAEEARLLAAKFAARKAGKSSSPSSSSSSSSSSS